MGEETAVQPAATGVKETKELVVGMLKPATLLVSVFKDGVQAQDFAVVLTKIQTDEALKAALLAAYNDADKAGVELKDLTLAEGFELLMTAIPEVKELVEAAAKKA